jgi:hypothetical protein
VNPNLARLSNRIIYTVRSAVGAQTCNVVATAGALGVLSNCSSATDYSDGTHCSFKCDAANRYVLDPSASIGV